MYKYETHLHTYPVSRCAQKTVRECLEFYKERGYDGVFVTNHFLCGNINCDRTAPFAEQLEFYFSDLEKAKELSKEIGIDVFGGAELSYKGTDFLIYGLDKAWYQAHPEIMEMTKREELKFMMEQPGSLVIQAHPFRESKHIDHIRLFPREVHGVEVYNGCRTPEENNMANIYADFYGLVKIAGSDYHGKAEKLKFLSGLCTEEKIRDEAHFVSLVKAGQIKLISQ